MNSERKLEVLGVVTGQFITCAERFCTPQDAQSAIASWGTVVVLDAQGNVVKPHDPKAVRWTLLGAIRAACHDTTIYRPVLAELFEDIETAFDGRVRDYETTDEVLEALKTRYFDEIYGEGASAEMAKEFEL